MVSGLNGVNGQLAVNHVKEEHRNGLEYAMNQNMVDRSALETKYNFKNVMLRTAKVRIFHYFIQINYSFHLFSIAFETASTSPSIIYL